MPLLSIIIPAYNEEKRIGKSLRDISAYFATRDQQYELLVVDDGSSDGTAAVVTAAAAENPHISLISSERNRGKGHALRMGVLASSGERVLVSDADLSTPIDEVETLEAAMVAGNCDIAIGSRALALSRILKRQPWWGQGMGKIFNRIVKFIVLDGFEDTQCGFKLFNGEKAREIFSRAVTDRFAYDVEILLLGRKSGYRIIEVPIRWINAPGSKVNPVVDSPRMVLDLLIMRYRLGYGHCNPKQG